MDTLIFVVAWSIGIGAFMMWFYKELTKNERK